MSDTCDTCGHEKAMGRCWRLTCPENGAAYGTMELARRDESIEPLPVPDLAPIGELIEETREAMRKATGIPIGEKVAHVRRAPNTGNHHCHWPGCNQQVKPAVWGCKKHWYMLPKELRDLIWGTFRPGQEQTKTPSRAYVEAAQAVQRWIAENHSPERKLL